MKKVQDVEATILFSLEDLWPHPSKLWLLKGGSRYAELQGPCDCMANGSKTEEEAQGCPMRTLGHGWRAVAAFGDKAMAHRLKGSQFTVTESTMRRALKIAAKQRVDGIIVCLEGQEGMRSFFVPHENL